MKNLIALSLCVASLALWAGAAAPIITNITMVGATPRFGVQSGLVITNQIQYCTSLSQTNWVVLTNLVVAQSPYWFSDVAAPASPQRFYRVLAVYPPPPSDMALIPAGSFTMGNCMATNEGDGFELPLHTVYVSAFYADKHEVTKSLWDTVYQWATNHGYSFDYSDSGQGKANNHPAHSMRWYDTAKWCNARREKEGRTPAYYTDAGLSARYRTG